MTTKTTLEAAFNEQKAIIERLQTEIETKDRTIAGLMADFASHTKIFEEKDKEIQVLKDELPFLQRQFLHGRRW
jgi:septal ring factor EnvC (AmiA/AmiB activator)